MAPWTIGAISAAILCGLVVAFFVLRKRAAVLESVASEFGSNASSRWGFFSDPVIAFEYEGYNFVGEVIARKYGTDYVMTFEGPTRDKQFLIRHNVPFAGTYLRSKDIKAPSATWHLDSTSVLAEKFILFSNDPAYLNFLLSEPKVFAELTKYEGAIGRFLEVSMDEGRFEVMLHCTGWDKYRKFRNVCLTATIFFDRIAGLK
jgi:hypothetical protein